MIQFRDGLRSQGFLPEILPDLAMGTVKPCDMIVCGPHGRFWVIEGKAVTIPSWASKQTLIGPRTFRSHQLPSLLRFAENGAIASVVLFVTPPRSAEMRAWLLDASCVAALLAQDGILRLSDLGNEAISQELATWELRRLPQSRWGLTDDARHRWYCQAPDLSGWQIKSSGEVP